jgi:molybdopterin/thiamine biosynthesis adenylyltransferase/rhodanese-related sulfurtransferase
MARRTASAIVKLDTATLRRYSRQILVPEIGVAGQERLMSSSALVVGAGGLGSAALQALAAAGVGRLTLLDADVVDDTNLARQTIYASDDVGTHKAVAAQRRLQQLNPHVEVRAMLAEFDASNGRELVGSHDVVLDCTDNFSARYLVNDACVLQGKLDISASIFRFEGTLAAYGGGGPCYRCLYPDFPDDAAGGCAEAGVAGPVAALLGSWQAAEAIKVLTGAGTSLRGRFLSFDGASSTVREFQFERDPSCAVCGDAPEIRELRDRRPAKVWVEEVGVEELDEALRSATLLDVREPHEAVFGPLDGALAIPLSQLAARVSELDSAGSYIVACRIGLKSRGAAERLRSAGIQRVKHLRGGLLAYAAARQAWERIV